MRQEELHRMIREPQDDEEFRLLKLELYGVAEIVDRSTWNLMSSYIYSG